MTPALRFGYSMALGGIAVGLVGMVYSKWPFIFLSIHYALCWFVWLACVYQRQSRKFAQLVLLWLLIDVGILVELVAFESNYGHGPLAGDEWLGIISYAPVVIPSLAIYFSMFADQTPSTFILWQFLGPTLGYVLPGWLALTICGAVQSLMLYSILAAIKPQPANPTIERTMRDKTALRLSPLRSRKL